MLRFFDSGDHYDTNALMAKYSGTNVPGSFFAVASGAGFGSGSDSALRGQFDLAAITSYSLFKRLSNQATWIAGVNLNVNFHPMAGRQRLMAWAGSGTMHCFLNLEGDGRLSISDGADNDLATSSVSIRRAVANYVEWKITISNAGRYEVRVNQAPVIIGSGDLQTGATGTANELYLLTKVAANFRGVQYMRDLYVCDGSGSRHTDFLGPVRVYALRPTSDTGSADFNVSTGATRFANVDDTIPDSDQTYNSATVALTQDILNYPALSVGTGQILGVQVSQLARRSDAVSRQIAPIIRFTNSINVGSTVLLTSSYIYHSQVYELNPITATSWSIASVNSSNFGYRLIA